MNESLQKIKKKINSGEVDAVFVSTVAHITHLTAISNFSNIEREAYLFITKNTQYVFTDARYSEAVTSEVRDFRLLELNADSPVEKHLQKLAEEHRIENLGIEEGNLTVAEFKRIEKLFKKISGIKLNDLRTVKQSWEIARIENACRIGDKAFAYILKQIRPGASETEIAGKLEQFILRNGFPISFDTIAAFGKNSSVPHHHTGKTILQDNSAQFVLLDFGVRFENYCSDMTRTVFWKKASLQQQKIYRTVLEAQVSAAEFIDRNIDKEGNAAEAAKIANDYVISKGFPGIPHGLGHGVGLEVHEHPRLGLKSKDKLTEGMVFSIEPGIYIPGFGGVRIEDLFVIEGTRLRQITQASKELISL